MEYQLYFICTIDYHLIMHHSFSKDCGVPHRKSGFSLVELSIVLVILGLLTGGILGGQALIRAAEMRSINTELEQWKTAVNIFNQKYMALPGDMRNATAFWGAVNTGGTGGNCSDPSNNVGTGTQTCNGNGDGRVTYGWGTGASIYEAVRFWQHLANAGLIQGEYTGALSATNRQHAGENTPLGKIGATWGFCSLNYNYGWQWDRGLGPHDTSRSNNTLCIGKEQPEGEPGNPFLTPSDAWNIDMKFDDGKPGIGTVTATRRGNNCTDASSATDWQAAEYRLDQTGTNCALLYMYAF